MLTKLPLRTVTPGVPTIPGVPETTVCTDPPPGGGGSGGGSWQIVCRTVVFPPNTSVQVPPGGSVTIISASPAGIVAQVCASEWVPNG